MVEPITVIKQNLAGEETWRYEGQVLVRQENSLILEANFNRDDMPFHGITLNAGTGLWKPIIRTVGTI